MNHRVRGLVHEIHAHLAREHELGGETQKNLVPVVVHAVVHRHQIAVGGRLLHLADGAQDSNRLVDADVEIAIIARIIPEHAHGVMQLANDQRNLERVQMLAQAQACLALLLVGVHVLQFPAWRHVRVAGIHVVRLDGVVRRLQKLPLDIPESRADFHVNARQVLFRNAPNHLVLGHILTFENKRAIMVIEI